jgi:hypothetical protein
LRSWRSGWAAAGRPIAIAEQRRHPHARAVRASTWETLEPDIHFEASARLAERLAGCGEPRTPAKSRGCRVPRTQPSRPRRGHAFNAAGHDRRQVEVEIEAEFFRAGAQHGPSSIVGSGPNGAILHAPTGRVLREGDIVMVDAGAEMDVTPAT